MRVFEINKIYSEQFDKSFQNKFQLKAHRANVERREIGKNHKVKKMLNKRDLVLMTRLMNWKNKYNLRN